MFNDDEGVAARCGPRGPAAHNSARLHAHVTALLGDNHCATARFEPVFVTNCKMVPTKLHFHGAVAALAAVSVVGMAACVAVAEMDSPSAEVAWVAPDDEHVQIIGRHTTLGVAEGGGAEGIAFDMPGVEVRARVRGATDIYVLLAQAHPPAGSRDKYQETYFDVVVDGVRSASPIVTGAGGNLSVVQYPVAAGLDPAREHELRVFKSTEAMWNQLYPAANFVVFHGFNMTGPAPATVPNAPLPARKIEFIGDSITAGYCNQCSGSGPAQERFYDSWANQICSTLGAQCHTSAWSGYGLVRNCCGGVTTMPMIYRRTLATVAEEDWGFSASGWTPDALVVNLGTNDHINGAGINASFAEMYRELVANVTRDYKPAPHLFLACGPMSTAYCGDVFTTIASASSKGLSATFLDQRGIFNGTNSCCGHPSVSADVVMAERGSATIKQAMGW